MGKLIYKIRLSEDKNTLTNIKLMPCYFVSSGVEIPMTNQTLRLYLERFWQQRID